MTAYSKDQIQQRISALFVDNGVGGITPPLVRSLLADLLDTVFNSIPGATGSILDGAVTTPKLADGAVTGGKMALGTITADRIAAGVIPTSFTPADGSIVNSMLASGVDGAKITDASIPGGKLVPGSVSVDADQSYGNLHLLSPSTIGVGVGSAQNLVPFGGVKARSIFSNFLTGAVTSQQTAFVASTITDGSGVFGVGNNHSGAMISSQKRGWPLTTNQGEIDGLYVIARNGAYGDCGGILIDAYKYKDPSRATTYDGSITAIEVAAGFLDSAGNPTRDMHAVLGFPEDYGGISQGTGYGLQLSARLSAFYTGLHVTTLNQYPGGTYGWKNAISCDYDGHAASTYFQVRGDQVTLPQVPGDIVMGIPGQQKTLRNRNTDGAFQIRNNADTVTLLNIQDDGTFTIFAGGKLIIPTGTVASSGAAGSVGQIQYDANYLYICIATNTWRRLGGFATF